MIVISEPEAALFHALLLNAAADCAAVSKHEKQLRQIAARLMPEKDGPEGFSRASHQS